MPPAAASEPGPSTPYLYPISVRSPHFLSVPSFVLFFSNLNCQPPTHRDPPPAPDTDALDYAYQMKRYATLKGPSEPLKENR